MSPGPLYSWTWRANTVVIMSRSGARDWVAWDVRTHLLRDVKTFQGLVVRCLVCGRYSVERWFNMSCNYIMPMSLALSTFLFPRLLISDLPIFYWLTSYSEIAVTLILGHFSIQFKMISMCTVEIPASLTSCFTPAINWAVVWELYVFIQTNTWCQLSLGESLDTLHFVSPCGISWFTTPIKPKYKVIWEPERSVHWDEVHLLSLLRSNPVRTRPEEGGRRATSEPLSQIGGIVTCTLSPWRLKVQGIKSPHIPRGGKALAKGITEPGLVTKWDHTIPPAHV